MSTLSEEAVSIHASTWSEEAEIGEIGECSGDITADEVEDIEEWEILDEWGEENESKDENVQEDVRIVKKKTEREVSDSSRFDKTEAVTNVVEASRLQTEERSARANVEEVPRSNETKDNITVIVTETHKNVEEWKRKVEATYLTRDLYLYKRNFGSQPQTQKPSGDRDPTTYTITVPLDNKLPRGLTSYERIPNEFLPDDIKFCPLCSMPKRFHMKRHILQTHFPWYWSPTTACWTCQEQAMQQSTVTYQHTMCHAHDNSQESFDDRNLHKWCQMINGSLYLLLTWLELETLEDLLHYVKNRKLTEGVQGSFTPQEIRCMRYYAINYSSNPYPNYRVDKPNHVICLIHFEIITRLLNRVRTESRLETFKQSTKCLTSEGLNISVDIPPEITQFEFIDTHFHLDLIVQRLSRPTLDAINFKQLETDIIHFNPNNICKFAIANYVFPHNWDLWTDQLNKHPSVRTTFGVHPHIASKGVSERQKRKLKQLVSTRECVGVGETGLDYTTTCNCTHRCNSETCKERIRANQEQSLVFHLQLAAEKNLPVVLHCRDSGDGRAAKRTLEIIHQHNFSNLAFHRHCFMGKVEEMESWMKLPRVVFGITGKICTAQDAYLEGVVAKVPERKLVLETDSPYLVPFAGATVNHPWNLITIAEMVSRIRNVPVTFLMDIVNCNAKHFYHL